MFTQEVMTYESNIAYTLRFMIDTKVGTIMQRFAWHWKLINLVTICVTQIVGMNWIELSPGNYTVRTGSKKVSSCQLEVDCRYVT